MKRSQQLRIFLLHARADEKVVRQLYRRLTKDGMDVWLDRESLLPGHDWQYEIRKAIYSSDIVIPCLSKQFNKQGGYRHEELRIALKRAKSFADGEVFIIPARLEDCEMPGTLCRWQRVDLFEADGYKKLRSALQEWVGSSYTGIQT